MKNILYLKKSNTIKYTLKKLNGAFGKFGCVIDSNKLLLGVVTEGDLRRAILNGISINNKLEKVINVKPTFVYKHELISKKISESNFNATNLNASIFYVPIVNKKRKVLDVLSIENLIDILENKASKKRKSLSKLPNVLIVGGAGYIGTILTSLLLKKIQSYNT